MNDSHGEVLALGDRVRVTMHGAGVPMHLGQGAHRIVGFTRTRVTLANPGAFTGTYNVPPAFCRLVNA